MGVMSKSTNRTIHELAVVLARVHRRLRHWIRHSQELKSMWLTVTQERDALLAERDRHNRSLDKARSAIIRLRDREAFDEIYRNAMVMGLRGIVSQDAREVSKKDIGG
jgi:hypothetical protein